MTVTLKCEHDRRIALVKVVLPTIKMWTHDPLVYSFEARINRTGIRFPMEGCGILEKLMKS